MKLKKKIIGIFVMTLLIANTATVIGTMHERDSKQNNFSCISTLTEETYMVSMRDDIKLSTDVYLPFL